MSKPKYLSMFWYGGQRTICSEHRTIKAAKKAAKKCENKGGAEHFFLKAEVVK